MSGLLRTARRSLRTWRNQLRLAREQKIYQELFLECGLAIPDEAEIRACVVSRFPGKAPKKKGELRILSIYHDYNWEGASLGPSLAKFGEACHLDWRDPELAAGGQPGVAGWKEAMNAGLLDRVNSLAAERPFDVVFSYLSGGQVTGETINGLRGLGAPMVNLALNDKESFVGKMRGGYAEGARDICRYFDLCWTSTADALGKYVVEGATPLYLPEGANPDIHKPYDEERIYDVSFVGQRYGNRPEVISRLSDAGIRVEVFGPGWQNGPLSTEEMVRTWSRSKINLGFGGVLGHKETYCLKGRDFELPMSGGLYLTEHHDELVPFYEIGREIITYTGFDDLLEKIRWLLLNPDQSDAIRRAGRERALREHTWEMRFERVFRLLGVLV